MKNKKLLICLVAILAVLVLVLSSCQKTEEKAKEAAAAVEEKVEEVKEEAAEVVDTAKEEAAAAVDTAKEEVAAAVDTAKEEVAEAAEKVEEKVEEVKEEVKEEAAEVAEKVEEAVDTAKEEAAAAVDTAKEEAAEAAEKVEEKVEEVKEEAAEAVAAATVMSHEEYVKADLDSPVCIEAYVQANQSWWDGKIKLYLQDENHGAYFAYDLPCTEEEAAKLVVPGTKVRITGVKAEWSGEAEIIDATYEILEGSFIAEPEDVTAVFGKDELINHMNEKIAVKDAKVVASKKADDETEYPFLYSWDGSGTREDNGGVGADLYFNVEIGGQTYSFTVESYLCNNSTDVYKAVEGLKVGDTIDCEGFLYWYNGANPHITSVTVK